MATTHRPTNGSTPGSTSAPTPRTDPTSRSGGLAWPQIGRPAARLLATLRIALGAVFLWAFLDKTFGLGWVTPGGRGWIDGGSPTRGFLTGLTAGPARSAFRDIAGAGWADWLFMMGLLAIGLALVLGVGMRVAAVTGAVLLMLMWLAQWPPARTGIAGVPTGSTNPLVDSHLIDALVLGTLAALDAGRVWGLAGWWSRTTLVRRYQVLR
jgi:thiosulfate dehydrogenase (quinone) large subunit